MSGFNVHSSLHSPARLPPSRVADAWLMRAVSGKFPHPRRISAAYGPHYGRKMAKEKLEKVLLNLQYGSESIRTYWGRHVLIGLTLRSGAGQKSITAHLQ